LRSRPLALASGVVVMGMLALAGWYLLLRPQPGPTRGAIDGSPSPATATPSPSASPQSPSPAGASTEPSASPSPDAAATEGPLSICCLEIDWITETTARVTWTASDNATGQLDYGTTTAYGSSTDIEPSFRYSTHTQFVAGLRPGTLYHLRAHSVDEAGNAAFSEDVSFTTLAADPAPQGACFGTCFGGDGLANTRVGYSGQPGLRPAQSFRAAGSSLASMRVYWLGGELTGYGAGTGGTIEATIRPNANGRPGSPILGTATFAGTTDVGKVVEFSPPVALTTGTIYWVVFENVDANPTANYSSVNSTIQFDPPSPLQPGWSDAEFRVGYYTRDGTWTPRGGYTAVIDVAYDDGSHSGQGYLEFWVHPGQHLKIGGDDQVRETFDNPAARTIRTMAARVERLTGSGPLTIALYSGSSLVATGNVEADRIARSEVGEEGGLTWAVVHLATPLTLAAGPTSIVVSAPSGTTYSTHAIRKGGLYGYPAGATYFAYGQGELSTNAGGAWRPLMDEPHEADIQFYLR
jgi:hypothetical protein